MYRRRDADMLIKSKQLRDIIMQVAEDKFGAARFRRRELLKAVENELRSRNIWTPDDDLPSSSSDPKSKGLANIDYRFSDLAREGRLVNSGTNTWQISPSILHAKNIVTKPLLRNITLLVEGSNDIYIAKALFRAAKLPISRILFKAIGSKSQISRFARDIAQDGSLNYAILIDADQQSVPDSKELARQQLGYPPFPVFCAVPQIEAWIFADDQTALQHAHNENAKDIIRRLPLPEQITYPKQVAVNVFGRNKFNVEDFKFLEEIDIERASARSPSLRDFLVGISDLLDEPISLDHPDISEEMGSDIFISLINEVANSDTVLWKTLDGTELTANRHYQGSFGSLAAICWRTRRLYKPQHTAIT